MQYARGYSYRTGSECVNGTAVYIASECLVITVRIEKPTRFHYANPRRNKSSFALTHRNASSPRPSFRNNSFSSSLSKSDQQFCAQFRFSSDHACKTMEIRHHRRRFGRLNPSRSIARGQANSPSPSPVTITRRTSLTCADDVADETNSRSMGPRIHASLLLASV